MASGKKEKGFALESIANEEDRAQATLQHILLSGVTASVGLEKLEIASRDAHMKLLYSAAKLPMLILENLAGGPGKLGEVETPDAFVSLKYVGALSEDAEELFRANPEFAAMFLKHVQDNIETYVSKAMASVSVVRQLMDQDAGFKAYVEENGILDEYHDTKIDIKLKTKA